MFFPPLAVAKFIDLAEVVSLEGSNAIAEIVTPEGKRSLEAGFSLNDVKSGPDGKGTVALWFEGSTVAR